MTGKLGMLEQPRSKGIVLFLQALSRVHFIDLSSCRDFSAILISKVKTIKILHLAHKARQVLNFGF